eukprot:TRINITY_DN11640_c0_g1_i1.p1 TRINITY_DN11640_c0_g1~~TRINITY_DN11640_c0_g1_i1.p1  ORF type:complete len:232 (+),score=104.85 TRINITY_DN11640_c0_g1_i1:60-698(+)
MGDISQKFREVQLQLKRAEALLEDLELNRGDDRMDVQTAASKSCGELARSILDLQDMVDSEHSGKREVLKRKVRALQEEHQVVQQGLEKFISGAQKRRMAARNRNQLFGAAPGDGDNQNAMRHLHQEQDSIGKSQDAVNNLVSEGEAILAALGRQGKRFDTIGDRLGSFMQTMGLSRSIITTISRTHRTDSLLVYSGMIVVSFCLFLIWWFK